MGQKVNPNSFRLGPKLLKTWQLSSFFTKKNCKHILQDTIKIKETIHRLFKSINISKINCSFTNNNVNIDIYCIRTKNIVGENGSGIEKIKSNLNNLNTKKKLIINVHEIKKPELEPFLVAQSIAKQIEKRLSFRKAMKKAVQLSMKQGAKGIKIYCSGRLDGAEIARKEKYIQGTVPLHTLRANIDYGFSSAKTIYGIIGIKVWLHKENIFEKNKPRNLNK